MPPEYAIETSELRKVYRKFWSRSSFCAVDGISLRVGRGSAFGLLGPNGAGKTTFVKMLLSSTAPTSGRAEIFGRDTRIPEARRSVGYLPENHRFPTYLTAYSMLDLYGSLSGVAAAPRRSRIFELLEKVGLEKWAHVPLGKYSKGMLQRVGLAQALLHRPELLILDEPGDGVDPVGRKQIRDILQSLEKEGVTIFLNSHLLSEVEMFCSEVAILHRGKVALSGKIADLTAGGGYRVEAEDVPERLAGAIEEFTVGKAHVNGAHSFHFASREDANRAMDLLRSERCEIEAVTRSRSTLEEVFLQTVEGSSQS